jgi:hypothetical protein
MLFLADFVDEKWGEPGSPDDAVDRCCSIHHGTVKLGNSPLKLVLSKIFFDFRESVLHLRIH